MYKKSKKTMAFFIAILMFFNIGIGVYAEAMGPELEDEVVQSTENTSEIKMEDKEEKLNPSLKLEVSLKDKAYKNGDTVDYEIRLKNDGEVDLENIKIKEDLNQEFFIKELKIGEENLINRNYKIDENNKLDEIANKVEIEVNLDGKSLKYEGQFKLVVTKEEPKVEEEPKEEVKGEPNNEVKNTKLEEDHKEGEKQEENVKEEEPKRSEENPEPETVMEEAEEPPLIMPMAISTPGSYTSDSNSIVVPTQLTGVSINNHTIPVLVWVNSGTLYAAVKSTHKLDYMKFGGMTKDDDDGVKNILRDEYNSLVNITVDGVQYEPSGLQGNTGDSHWTVFKFLLTGLPIPTDGQLQFFVKGIGGGHDVGGYMAVTIPKTDITGTKEWFGGPKPPIKLQLKRYVEGKESTTTELVKTKSLNGTDETTAWSYTWTQMQEYSSYGEKFIYYIDEETVPANYEKTIDENGGRTVTNTYKAPKTSFTATKEWVGGTKPVEEVKFQLYRAIENEDPVTVEDPVQLIGNSYTWTGLEETNTDGNEYIYSFKESSIPENYTPSYDGNTVTNTYISPKVTITGTKEWVDQKKNLQFSYNYIEMAN